MFEFRLFNFIPFVLRSQQSTSHNRIDNSEKKIPGKTKYALYSWRYCISNINNYNNNKSDNWI